MKDITAKEQIFLLEIMIGNLWLFLDTTFLSLKQEIRLNLYEVMFFNNCYLNNWVKKTADPEKLGYFSRMKHFGFMLLIGHEIIACFIGCCCLAQHGSQQLDASGRFEL